MLPENVPVVVAFRRISTQWRYAGAGMGGLYRTGLDYAAVMPVLQSLVADWTDWTDWTAVELLERIQVLEEAMLEADSERNPDGAAS